MTKHITRRVLLENSMPLKGWRLDEFRDEARTLNPEYQEDADDLCQFARAETNENAMRLAKRCVLAWINDILWEMPAEELAEWWDKHTREKCGWGRLLLR